MLALECQAGAVAACRDLCLFATAHDSTTVSPVRAVLLPLMAKHMVPQLPLPLRAASGVAEQEARRRVNIALAELLALVLASLEPTFDVERYSLRGRLVKLLTQEIGAFGTAASVESMVGSGTDQVRQLLGAAHRLLHDFRDSEAVDGTELLNVLLESWHHAAQADCVRLQLLPILVSRILPPSLFPTVVSAAPLEVAKDGAVADLDLTSAGLGGVSLSAESAFAWVRSLPKLLWQLDGRCPALSEAMLRALIAVGRAGDGCTLARWLVDSERAVDAHDFSKSSTRRSDSCAVLQALRAALEPYFCAFPRDTSRAPVFGPFVRSGPHLRRLALQLLRFLKPLPESLVASLGRCAASAPHLAHEIASFVEAAAGNAQVEPEVAASLALTIAFNIDKTIPIPSCAASATAGDRAASATTGNENRDVTQSEEEAVSSAWCACVDMLRQFVARYGPGVRVALEGLLESQPLSDADVTPFCVDGDNAKVELQAKHSELCAAVLL